MGININIDTSTNINELIRLLLIRQKMSIAELARQMGSRSGKEYSRFNLRAKLENESLKFKEMILICEILGYKMDLIKEN